MFQSRSQKAGGEDNGLKPEIYSVRYLLLISDILAALELIIDVILRM